MNDNEETGKCVGEDRDNSPTTHMHTQVDEDEKGPNPTQVLNVDLKIENCVDGKAPDVFPVENPAQVDSASSALKTANDTSMAANEVAHGNAGTEVSDIIYSSRREPDSPPKRSMEIEPDNDNKGEYIEETDGSDLNHSNQKLPSASHERSMEMEAKDDQKGHDLNVGMSNMELSPNREVKDLVTKPKLDVEHEFRTKGSEQSSLSATYWDEGDDSGTEEDQAAFMMEVENFCKEKSLEFKPPKFYQKELNLLK